MVTLRDALHLKAPWGRVALPTDWLAFAATKVRCWANEGAVEVEYSSAEVPDDCISRLAFALDEDREEQILFFPAMPARNIFLRLGESLLLGTGESLTLRIRLPLYLRIYRISKQVEEGVFLFELPCFDVKSAWHGRPSAGELTYWLKQEDVDLRNRDSQAELSSFEALWSVTVNNVSNTAARLEFLVLKPEVSGLYVRDGTFIADAATLEFRGPEFGLNQFQTLVTQPVCKEGQRLFGPYEESERSIARDSLRRVLRASPFRIGSAV